MSDFEKNGVAPADELKRLLAEALVEVPCAECGRYALTFEKNRRTASFECPGCGKRTFLVRDERGCSIFSETRLIRLVRFVRARRWYCPEHPGVPVVIAQIQTNPEDPRKLKLNYICRRGFRGFGKRRVHDGALTVDLLTLEAEMLARGG